MPSLTTKEAAAYLAGHGYTVGRRWHGGRGPISARTLRKWCEMGRFQGAIKVGEGNRAIWKIPKSEIDRLLEAVGKVVGSTPQDTAKDRVTMREGERDQGV